MHINSALIKFFQVIQDPDYPIPIKKLLESGTPEETVPSRSADMFKWFIYVLQVLSFLAVCLVIKRKDGRLAIPLTVYMCFCFAHTITYMDFMYYYVKIPFLFLFAGYFLNILDQYRLRIGGKNSNFGIGYGQLINCGLLAVMVGLNFVVII